MTRRNQWALLLFLTGMTGYITYRSRRRLIAGFLGIGPSENAVEITRGRIVPAQDGVPLVHDHYIPVDVTDAPTIMMRSPYGRNRENSFFGMLLSFFAERFAERGYHVILQDVRGRFDSGGEFRPYLDEKDDALATIAWLREQPWFNGKLGLWGASYLGIVQWIVAQHAPEVKAIMPLVAATNLRNILYHDDALDYGLAMRWLSIFQVLDKNRDNPLLNAPAQIPEIEMRSRRAHRITPVAHGDQAAVGETIKFYQEWLEQEEDGTELWEFAREQIDMTQITAPAHLIAGWHDFFLREQINDYHALVAAGAQPHLTIGPWSHFSKANIMLPGIREGLCWFDTHLKQQPGQLRDLPVRLYVIGADEWRNYASYPPPSDETTLYLHGDGSLATMTPEFDLQLHYTYDPQDPTPSVGGAQFTFGSVVVDNRKLERRDDVLVFTSAILPQNLEIIGPVRLQLYVKSSLDYTDFYGCLLDVHPDGRSLNVCDGLFRIKPDKIAPQPDGTACIEVDLWSTAHQFAPGHRIRLQVASGAHPRWLANSGTGDPIRNTTQTRIAHQTVYTGASHPSALILPVTAGSLPG